MFYLPVGNTLTVALILVSCGLAYLAWLALDAMAKWRYRYFDESILSADFEAAEKLRQDYGWHFEAQGKKFEWYIERGEIDSAKTQLDMTFSVGKLIKKMNLRKRATSFGLYYMWTYLQPRRGLMTPKATVYVFIPSATGRAMIKSKAVVLCGKKALSDTIFAAAKCLVDESTEEISERVAIDALLLANAEEEA